MLIRKDTLIGIGLLSFLAVLIISDLKYGWVKLGEEDLQAIDKSYEEQKEIVDELMMMCFNSSEEYQDFKDRTNTVLEPVCYNIANLPVSTISKK